MGWLLACCRFAIVATHEIDKGETLQCLTLIPRGELHQKCGRARYACWACEEAVVQAPAPERPITGGMATEALLAHVLVAKYADFLPLYRQAQIFARQGIALDRSTLMAWTTPATPTA